MKKSSPFDFKTLSKALDKTTSKMHASQVHGLICGLLCGKSEVKAGAWESLILGEAVDKIKSAELAALYAASKAQLVDFLFEFDLVLPKDTANLPERAEALTLWCQGYLTGLKLVEVPIEGREPSEVTEAIHDLVEIAKMNYEQVVSSEEDEVAFAELVEYVRMVVIFIYQELVGDSRNAQTDHRQLH